MFNQFAYFHLAAFVNTEILGFITSRVTLPLVHLEGLRYLYLIKLVCIKKRDKVFGPSDPINNPKYITTQCTVG